MTKVRVPYEDRAYRTKPEIALEEINRISAAGVRFGYGLADVGYGLSAPSRQDLSERGLVWTVGGARRSIPRTWP